MAKYQTMNRFGSSQTNVSINRSRFKYSNEELTTFSSGYWFPVMCQECLPGSTYNVDSASLVRMLTPVVPVMDNLIMDLAAFWVPFRLCTKDPDDWPRCCGSDEPDAWEADYEQPDLTSTGNIINYEGSNVSMSLANYLGLPIQDSSGGFYGISRLPFAACWKIWNDWLRDENTTESIDISDDSNDSSVFVAMSSATSTKGSLPAFKIKDYFTSALPSPQKGAAVYVPLGSNAPIASDSISDLSSVPVDASPSLHTMSSALQVGTSARPEAGTSSIGGLLGTYQNSAGISGTQGTVVVSSTDFDVTNDVGDVSVSQNNLVSDLSSLYADLSAATGASVNQIRMSFAVQRLEEKLARGGSRYNEYLKAVFGVDAPNGLIQMSEFLGGATIPINITQVLQTSSTDSTSPLGSTGAFSNTFSDRLKFTKSTVENGYIIVMCTVRPVQSYSQGIPVWFRHLSNLDIYQPTFAHIGEQPIYTEELYYSLDPYQNTGTARCGTSGVIDTAPVFGYKEAWTEYRTGCKTVSGDFAPAANDLTLQSWTFTSYFDSIPTLSYSFLKQPSSQVGQTLVDTETTTQFIGDFVFNITATLPMPVNSVPGLIDHF